MILHVGDTVSQNFTMEIGATTESVTVSAEAVPVNTEDATVGTVVERQVVENMPLNGRSFQGLITLSPGVATVTAGTASTGQFVVNGQRTDTNYFTVDGVSANVGAPTGGFAQFERHRRHAHQFGHRRLQQHGVGRRPAGVSHLHLELRA